MKKYTSADLDWRNDSSRSSIEMKDRSCRPPIIEKDLNLEDYDRILLGFPVWWYTAPMIIHTFIEKNSFLNKEIFLFVTSGGSGVVKCLEDLKKEYPNLNFQTGKRLTGKESPEEIISWLSRGE